MIGLLLGVFVALQANPTGTVTGIVRDGRGMPASGIRVYAMAVSDGKAVTADAVLEGIARTDENGRYTLHVPPGSYYIAAGSVDRPTYFPGTAEVSQARAIAITSTATIDNIDFSQFVPASLSQPHGAITVFQPPGATGAISGVLRFPDGTPARSVPVTLVPPNTIGSNGAAGLLARLGTGNGAVALICLAGRFVTLPNGPAPANLTSPGCVTSTTTDAGGVYRFTNVIPGSYFVVAGYADAPAFFPGGTTLSSATQITTTSTTKLDKMDFTVPPAPTGTAVRGRVSATDAMPAGGVIVLLQPGQRAVIDGLSMLPTRPARTTNSSADGSFQFSDVEAGQYTVVARLPGAATLSRPLSVGSSPLTDVDFAFPVATVSGQVLSEDGSPFPNAQLVREVAVVTTTNPNLRQTTILPLDATGKFSRIIDADVYRFYLRALPAGYVIKSMTAGTTDLLKQPLRIDGTASVNIEVRLAKRSEPAGVAVRGKVVDSRTGNAVTAQRIELCCVSEGPFEVVSAELNPGGGFEFSGIPPGRYLAEVRSKPPLVLAEHAISVADRDVVGITLASAAQLVPVQAQLKFEGGAPAAPAAVSLVMTGGSQVPISTEFRSDGSMTLWLPPNDRYVAAVANVPDGYIVKSIVSGASDLMKAGSLLVLGADPVPGFATIQVTLAKTQSR